MTTPIGTPTPKPTAGRVVLYTLSPSDLEHAAGVLPGGKLFTDDNGKPDRVEWQGNPLRAGDVFAADVVRVWSDPCVNLIVKLDGPATLWLTSRNQGDAEGHWHWPSRA